MEFIWYGEEFNSRYIAYDCDFTWLGEYKKGRKNGRFIHLNDKTGEVIESLHYIDDKLATCL